MSVIVVGAEAHVVAVLLALLVASGGAVIGDESIESVESTRDLLREYDVAKSAAVREPLLSTVLDTFRERRPTQALRQLFERRDDVIMQIGGTGWATVCRTVDSQALRQQVVAALRDPDPRWRAFACNAVRGLNLQEAAPLLRELLEDDDAVSNFLGEPPVALSAAAALASLGHPDGIELLLDDAEQHDGHASAYVPLFKKVSGQDFGDDLAAWRKWFEDEASRPR